MKRFLLTVSLFAALVVLIFGGWSALLLVFERQAYLRELKMPADASVVVACDSHTEAALDPAYFPGLFNFSQSAAVMDQIGLKQRNLMAANPGRIRLFLLDLSPYLMYAHDLSLPLEAAGPCARLFLLHCWNPKDNRRSLTGLPKMFRDVVLAKRSKAVFRAIRKHRPYRSSLGGGYHPSDRQGFVTHREKVEAECALKVRQIADAREAVLRRNFEEAQRFVDRARAAGIRVVLLTTPYHPLFRKQADPEKTDRFFAAMAAFAAHNGCPWLNTYSMTFPDTSWRDVNHLNAFASQAYTERVRAFVCEQTGECAQAVRKAGH